MTQFDPKLSNFYFQQQQQNDNVIPMPTLYNDSNESAPDGRGGPRQPRMGTIEVLLYNMASMLAGVAVGYDVRLSNVSPIHPKLYPKRYVKTSTVFKIVTKAGGVFLHEMFY